MASLSTLEKFQNLGFKIIKTTEANGAVGYALADPGKYGSKSGLYSLTGVTDADISSAGLSDSVVALDMSDDVGRNKIIAGLNVDFGTSKGNLSSLKEAESTVLNKLVSNIENALKTQSPELSRTSTILVGNQEYGRDELENIVGSVEASSAAVEAQRSANLAGTDQATGTSIATASGVTQPVVTAATTTTGIDRTAKQQAAAERQAGIEQAAGIGAKVSDA